MTLRLAALDAHVGMSVLDLARPEIRAMQPYSSARMEAGGGEVWLNANESAWAPTGDADWAATAIPNRSRRSCVAALAALYGVRHEQLLVGRGSDEAIDLLVRAFCRAGEDAILIQPPTFGMYAVCARIQNAARDRSAAGTPISRWTWMRVLAQH